MFKKTITYDDYNGESHTEDFYFNLSKAELIEMEVSQKGGFTNYINAIVESQDGAQIIGHFKQIILMAIGKKSPDGKRFIKSQEIRDEFSQTEAYVNLFIELSTDDKAASEFIEGLVPAGLLDEAKKAAEKNPELATAPPVLEGEASSEIVDKTPQEMSREELLEAYKQKLGS